MPRTKKLVENAYWNYSWFNAQWWYCTNAHVFFCAVHLSANNSNPLFISNHSCKNFVVNQRHSTIIAIIMCIGNGILQIHSYQFVIYLSQSRHSFVLFVFLFRNFANVSHKKNIVRDMRRLKSNSISILIFNY